MSLLGKWIAWKYTHFFQDKKRKRKFWGSGESSEGRKGWQRAMSQACFLLNVVTVTCQFAKMSMIFSKLQTHPLN